MPDGSPLDNALLRQGLAWARRVARRPGTSENVPLSPGSQLLAPADDTLPLVVAKVEEDVRSRLALKRMGYLNVLIAYLRHRRDGKDTFYSFGADHLWPSMHFVRDWLKQERRRVAAQYRTVFLLSLAATLAAGFAFLATLVILG